MNKVFNNNEQRNEENIMGNNLVEQENEFNAREELINNKRISKILLKNDCQKLNEDVNVNQKKELEHNPNELDQYQDQFNPNNKDHQTQSKNDQFLNSQNDKIDTQQDKVKPCELKQEKEVTEQEHIKNYRNFFIILAKESPKRESSELNENSDSETYGGSYHCRETDVCRDSTDTESNSSFITDGIATIDVLEYDLASSSSSEILYTDEESSSGTDDFVLKSAVIAKEYTEGILNQSSFWASDFADTEESSSSDFDYELSKDDYWTCVKCKNTSNNPKCRYCEKCYQIRKTHFPPRPRNYRSRQKNRKRKFEECSTKLNDDDENSAKQDAESSLIPNKRLMVSLKSKYGKNNCIFQSNATKRDSNSYSNNSRLNSAGSSDDSDICSNSNKSQSTYSKNIRKRKSSPNEINCVIKKGCYDLETDLYKKDSGISSAPSSQEIIGISSTATGSSADEIKIANSKKSLCASSDDTSCEDFDENELLEIQKNSLPTTDDFCDHNSLNLEKNTLSVTEYLEKSSNKSIRKNSRKSEPSIKDHLNILGQNSKLETVPHNLLIKEIENQKPITFENSENVSSKDLFKKTSSATTLHQDDSNCIVCFNSSKNGVFVHSNYCCLCCCYKCAKRIWSRNGRCPICNCAVRNIMKLFIH